MGIGYLDKQNNAMICLSDKQTIDSQLVIITVPMPRAILIESAIYIIKGTKVKNTHFMLCSTENKRNRSLQ